jgi:hypothetical protein
MAVAEKTNGFDQLCCWQGTDLGDKSEETFVDWVAEEFGVRAKFAEVVYTLPDEEDYGGETGGRSDMLFWVHSEDIPKFAVNRLAFGIRWWEDVILNGGGWLYTDEIARKYPFGWDDEGEEVSDWNERGAWTPT